MAEQKITNIPSTCMSYIATKRARGMDLPSDTLVVIFLRLEIKPLIRCRCVCKLWRNIINKYFADHGRISSAAAARESQLILIRSATEDSKTTSKVYAINPLVSSNIFTLSEYPIAEFTNLYYFIYLGHGLFMGYQGRHGLTKSYFLYNPINGEKLILPPSITNIADKGSISGKYGLGFNNFNNQYKLFHLAKFSETKVATQIYTLGSNEWKLVSAVPPCKLYIMGEVVPAYGDVHFLVNKSKMISFEFSKEEFKLTSLPGDVFSIFSLFNWRENLAILDITRPYKQRLKMYVLRDHDNASRWEKLYTIQRGGPNHDLLGTWEDRLVFDVHKYEPCINHKDCVEDARELCCYNPDTREKAIMRNPYLSLSRHRRRDEKIKIYRGNLVSLARYPNMADECSRY